MSKKAFLIRILMVSFICTTGCGDQGDDPVTPNGNGNNGDQITWSEDIQPLLNDHCVLCHGQSGELDLSTYQNAVSGGASGAAIVPNNADTSLIVKRIISDQTGTRMPVGGPYLSEIDIQKIKTWINAGARNN